MENIVSKKLEIEKRSKFAWAFIDTGVMIKRSILHIKEDLEQLIGLTVQPIMFVVLFRYVFGGAIQTGGVTYVNFLMAGIFVQTAAFGSTVTGVGIASDMQKGIMDRFRSLPMTKSAVITGHVVADLFRNALATVVMILAGLAVGFRPEANVGEWILVFFLLMFFTFSLSWVSAIIGLMSKSVEFVQQIGFVWIFPLTFLSSAFVPTSTMPYALRVFAENQPMTRAVEAVRGLLLGIPVSNHVWATIIWCTAILVIAFPIATWVFRKQSK